MTTLFPHLRFGLIAAVLAFFALHARAADAAPAGVLAFSIDVPGTKLSLKEVHDVVLSTSVQREWGVKEDTEDKVVIYLNHRKNEATVTYLITEKTVKAYCEGYATDGKGVRRGPEQPTGWLNRLRNDITKNLGVAVYGAVKK